MHVDRNQQNDDPRALVRLGGGHDQQDHSRPALGPGRPRRDLAASDVVTVDERDTLELAARRMVEHGTARVVTVDGAGRPSGIVSTLDVAAVVGVTGG